jgi:hypothetical protein
MKKFHFSKTIYLLMMFCGLFLKSYSHFILDNQIDEINENHPVQWINSEFGIGLMIKVDSIQARSDDPNFLFGFSYEIPVFEGKNHKVERLNEQLKEVYGNIFENNVLPCNFDSALFHSITFEYFIHDSIMSMLIKQQHAYFQSETVSQYIVLHFDFLNQEQMNTRMIFNAFGFSEVPLLNAIAEQCVMPDDSKEPLFDSQWFETIKWSDLNKLKILVDKEQRIIVIIPLAENGIEQKVYLL